VLRKYFVKADVAKDDDRIKQFLRYLSTKYIRDNAPHLPQFWAEMTSIVARTTNACESFHAAFNKRLIKKLV